jgi:hypothetical protein
MSIFGKIRRSRQAAKEHKDKQAGTQKAESERVPYRHVPTHAAIDAIHLAPTSWKKHDKLRIIEQNKRRSALMAAGAGGNVSAVFLHPPSSSAPTRVNSSLSIVAYPGASGASTPPVPLPRASSYAGFPSLSKDQRGVISLASRLRSVDVKGKRPMESSTPFPNLAEIADASQPAPDSGFASKTNSIDLTGSHSDLEMKHFGSAPTIVAAPPTHT